MVSVGPVVVNEKFHNITDHPNFQKEKLVTEYYAKEISGLATKGAEFVVLPERAINITKEAAADIIKILSNVQSKMMFSLSQDIQTFGMRKNETPHW